MFNLVCRPIRGRHEWAAHRLGAAGGGAMVHDMHRERRELDLDRDVENEGDETLLRLAAGGNRQAFAELYRRHHALTWRVARATTLSDDDAVAAVADAFVCLLEGDVDDAASFRAFLAGTVRDAALDRLHRRRGNRSEAPRTLDLSPTALADEWGDWDLDDETVASLPPGWRAGEVSELCRRLPSVVPAPPPELWALVQVAWNDAVGHHLRKLPLARTVVDQLPSETSWLRG